MGNTYNKVPLYFFSRSLTSRRTPNPNAWKRPTVTTVLRGIFVWPWKMVSVRVRYLFYQPMDEKIKTWPLSFLAKENSNGEKALFDWPIMLQFDVKAKYRLISRKFSGIKFFHLSVRLTEQKPCAFGSVQIALFLFCSRVFTSRSYENRSIIETFFETYM